ncbi:glutamate racemase [Culicoidibacter larvae]|uniref:Glutamate racemase n=1 Tax=Culicoidibacter larvae TaxID=2579976 RepID=A0A5R8Q9W7_9FIRM|nr:glutamate racemase [Culicoidibacter larvae]TLG71762.1 glutamate racemase [Culicoidibacter larvae]
MEKQNKPIGFIDSGIGGLSVVDEFLTAMPEAPIVFVADNARCPYGNREPEEIQQFAFEMIDYLISEHDIQLLMIACNTIVSRALDAIIARYPDLPIVDVVSNGAKVAANLTFTEHVSVLATFQTVQSESYVKMINRYHPNLTIEQFAPVEWVPMIEACSVDESLIRNYTDQLSPESDCVVLGCTHYPFILPQLKAVAPDKAFINPAYQTVQEALPLINRELFLGHCQLVLTTGDAAEFADKIKFWLPERDFVVEHVELT